MPYVDTVFTKPMLTRFWNKVAFEEGNDCWLWIGSGSKGKGYGRFYVNGKCRPAHRFSYELHVGPIPEGLVIDHLCRNPPCVNPAHLEPVTRLENLLRGNHHIFDIYTHCIRGHALSDDNIYTNARNKIRECKACKKVRRDKSRQDYMEGKKVFTETHCKNGHAYTPENTSFWPSMGVYACKTCNKIREKTRRERKKQHAI